MADEDHVTTAIVPQSGLREKALGALHQLPPFSPTLSKLLATLAKEDVFYGELAAIIEKDTVLAGHVLKLVNSALYARSGTINSVRHAVSIIGLNKLRNVALSLSVARMWKQVKTPKSWSQAAFNLHSVANAVMADILVQRLPVAYPEGAFTAGLMHGMGKMMIAIGLPQEYDSILKLYQESTAMSMEEAEMQSIGCHHHELCQAALANWKLPEQIQDAVGAVRHNGDASVIDLATLLHHAHEIVNQLGVMIPACATQSKRSAHEMLSDIGLEHHAEGVITEYRNEFGAMRAFF